jgi:hypothetical protein
MNIALINGAHAADHVLAHYRILRPDHVHDRWSDAVEVLAVTQNPDGVVEGMRLARTTVTIPQIYELCEARAAAIAGGP